MNGRRDFIGDLFESLRQTLQDDPVPLEIIVADDGSTDDSLETCRAWAARSWRGGEPFCRLIELPHCGVLSLVANRLTSEARGEYCCRLDGDIVIPTRHWASIILRAFEQGPPDLGVIGPKQLGLDGRIHSAGSWILHPRSHHHIGQGAIAHTITRSMEVDHVMGCFYCHRRKIWEQIGGYDESILRGQTIDFGLRARLAGWRTFSIPTVEFIHAHADRARRDNEADSPDGIERTLDRFRLKWGFDRLAADLDEVAERYRRTPLLWNARVFGPSQPWPPPSGGPQSIEQSEWGRFAKDEAFRVAISSRVSLVEQMFRQLGARRRVLHVRSRAGLLCHLLAQKGIETIGVDPDPNFVDLARSACDRGSYRVKQPEFVLQEERSRLPLGAGSVDAVLLFDVLETHPNPVGLLKESHRVLAEDGALSIVTRERRAPFDSDFDVLHAYRPHELVLQVQGTRCFSPVPVEGSPNMPGAVALFGTRRSEPEPGFYPRRESDPAVLAGRRIDEAVSVSTAR